MGKNYAELFRTWFYNKVDVAGIRGSWHYMALCGVSVFVFYNIENTMRKIRKQAIAETTEREYEQGQLYDSIEKKIKEFDGNMVARPDFAEQKPQYRFERK